MDLVALAEATNQMATAPNRDASMVIWNASLSLVIRDFNPLICGLLLSNAHTLSLAMVNHPGDIRKAMTSAFDNLAYLSTERPEVRNALLAAEVDQKLVTVVHNIREDPSSIGAVFALCFLVGAEEEHELYDTIGNDALRAAVAAFKATLDREGYHGSEFKLFLPTTAVAYLCRRERNKRALVDLGMVLNFRRCLAISTEPRVVKHTCQGLMQLCSLPDIHAQCSSDPVLRSLLDEYCRNQKHEAATALVAFLQTQSPLQAAPALPLQNVERVAAASLSVDVMLSYSHPHRSVVRQLALALRDRGLTVWIDTDHMVGSTLEAVGNAIGCASLICLFIGQSFKDSPNNRVEAEVAARANKPLLAVRVEDSFTPTGWLAAVLRDKPIVDWAPNGQACVQTILELLKPPSKASKSLETVQDVQRWCIENKLASIADQIRSQQIDATALFELRNIVLQGNALAVDMISSFKFNSLGEKLQFIAALKQI